MYRGQTHLTEEKLANDKYYKIFDFPDRRRSLEIAETYSDNIGVNALIRRESKSGADYWQVWIKYKIKNPGSKQRFKHKRLESPKHFDPRSFRIKRLGTRRELVVGCPTGKYDPRHAKCKVGTRAQAILKKRNPFKPWFFGSRKSVDVTKHQKVSPRKDLNLLTSPHNFVVRRIEYSPENNLEEFNVHDFSKPYPIMGQLPKSGRIILQAGKYKLTNEGIVG